MHLYITFFTYKSIGKMCDSHPRHSGSFTALQNFLFYLHPTDTSVSSVTQPALEVTSGDLTLRTDLQSSATSLRSPLVHKATRCEDLQHINESTPISSSSGDDLQTSAFHFSYFSSCFFALPRFVKNHIHPSWENCKS